MVSIRQESILDICTHDDSCSYLTLGSCFRILLWLYSVRIQIWFTFYHKSMHFDFILSFTHQFVRFDLQLGFLSAAHIFNFASFSFCVCVFFLHIYHSLPFWSIKLYWIISSWSNMIFNILHLFCKTEKFTSY